MKIARVEAGWLRVPIPITEQVRSDYGLMDQFNVVIVRVTTDGGLEGFGEVKAGGGALSTNIALLAMIRDEIGPRLIGRDPRRITRIFEEAYNGGRVDKAIAGGRTMPAVGARGLAGIAASGIDIALWDLLGKSLGVPVAELIGGRLRDAIPLYASGGWGDVDTIGAELSAYAARGFKAVKMRVGVAYGSVEASLERVRAARSALPETDLMVDAHGTYSVALAKQFARRAEPLDLRWFEEPVSPDDLPGLAELRAVSPLPIASGENELQRFAFRDLMTARAIDVAQPDLAICGGLTEGLRIAALADAHQVEVAPHVWGGAILFGASAQLAAASLSASILEYPAASNPVVGGLSKTPWKIENGMLRLPDAPGIGVEIDEEFLKAHLVA